MASKIFTCTVRFIYTSGGSNMLHAVSKGADLFTDPIYYSKGPEIWTTI